MATNLRKLKDQATNALAKNKHKKALKLFQKVVKEAPNDIYSRQKLAELLARIGHNDLAIREYQHLAGRYASDGMFLKSIAICKVILQIDPTHKHTQAILAELFAERQRVDMESRISVLPASMTGALQHAGISAPPAEAMALEQTPPLSPFPADQAVASSLEEDKDEFELVIDQSELVGSHEGSEARIDVSTFPPTPLFSSLPKEALITVIEKLNMQWTNPGEYIAVEGELGSSMYVIIQGTFQAMHKKPDGTELVLKTMSPGTFFGEIALLADVPRLASVVSTDQGLLLELNKDELANITQEHPSVQEIVCRSCKQRLLENLIKSSRIFRKFPLEVTHNIVNHSRTISAEPGAILLQEGEAGSAVYLLLRGSCEVMKQKSDGQEVEVNIIREGGFFGEISVLLYKPCTATVRAQTPCVFLQVLGHVFRTAVISHDEVLQSIHQLVEKRLEHNDAMIDILV